MAISFRRHLVNEVKRIGRRENLAEDKAFLFWFAVTILELSDDDAREAISVEGANDKGIDLFWKDDDEGRIVVAQGKYSNDFSFRPKIGHLAKLQSSLDWLINPEALRRDGKIDLAQAAEDYVDAIKENYGVELWFVYAGPKCPNIDKQISVYNQNPENLSKQRIIRHYHAELIEANWLESKGTSSRIDHERIAFIDKAPKPLNGDFGEAIVVSIPGSEIVKIYARHEEKLFDRNVRLFLGARKGSVNAGIAETLRDPNSSKYFWAFNNGITIICDEFKPGNKFVELNNFSIVNGCQTVVSLSQAPGENISRVSVLARIIAASSEIVNDIIQFTNSQNPIRTWDIASQDRTQRRLQTGFGQLSKPYIYLTRRGARPKGNLKKYRADGKLKQIRIDLMGQYAAAFRGYAVLSYKHKAFIFSKYHDDVFPPDVRVDEVLFQWICGEIARATVQKTICSKTENEARILRKGGTLFVLSAMSKILSLRNGATYLNDCKETAIQSRSLGARLRKYAEYARDLYIQAVQDQCQLEGAELATLIRQPDFNRKVMDRIERQYGKDSRAVQWLKEALPKINLR